MNRRATLKATGSSILAGTTLLASSVAGDGSGDGNGPTVVSVETETVGRSTQGSDHYTVEYLDDGVVEITGRTVAPTPCHEVAVERIQTQGEGDVVVLSLVSDSKLCVTSLAGVTYTVRLEYEAETPDVFVSVPDGV
ncbi:hypothetical protein [Natrinema halophilum]|uniref:Uncharacterized protein n=1 Tax=Natrinema halophilum TaxID=1699371 RepID=A0A7D5GNE3_9EURY|nr:hypothetical protein [Natrinema halophilum]QLG50852.1 hypothetical protein HYG82_19435 [Natrinema halophilum]